MTTSNWIQAGILFITLLALIFQQAQQLRELRKADKRTETKLKIFFLCQDVARTEQEIVQHFEGMSPNQRIDKIEIRKTIYEMLVDETLRYRTNGTFKARRNKATDQEAES